MGCVANIVQSLKLPDGNVKVLVEGADRARAVEWKEDKGFYRVVVKVIPQLKDAAGDVESAMSRVVSLFEQYVKLSNNLHYDAMIAAVRVEDPGKLADTIASHLVVSVEEKQNLLEIISPLERLNRISGILEVRGGQAPGGPPHPVARQEADGEGPEGVLPQREDEGDPEGTGPQGREGERGRRAEEEDRTGEDAEGRRGEGDPGAEAARGDAPDVGRSDRLAQLPRLADRRPLAQEVEGEPRPEARRGDPPRGPLRPGEDQGADPRVPGGPRAGQEAEGDDPHLLGPSRASARPRSPSRSRGR